MFNLCHTLMPACVREFVCMCMHSVVLTPVPSFVKTFVRTLIGVSFLLSYFRWFVCSM